MLDGGVGFRKQLSTRLRVAAGRSQLRQRRPDWAKGDQGYRPIILPRVAWLEKPALPLSDRERSL